MKSFWLTLSIYLAAPQTWIAFVFGAVVGSFLNVCIYRIPEGTFFKHQRSVCRQCGALVPIYLNIPILSWFFLRGKTRCCQTPLSLQYPLVELLTGIMFAIFYWKFPFIAIKGPLIEWDYANLLRFGHGAIFSSLLIVCSVIDFRHMIIPDVISLPMIAATPLVVWLHPELDGLSAFLGIIVGGGSLYAIAWIYWLIRREIGMGMGDVKLLAGIGGWLGYQAIIPSVFLGSILGAISGLLAVVLSRRFKLNSAIPFGPFLAIGAIIYLILGPYLNEFLFVRSSSP